ncbi:MAG TPA: hypothetical protein VG815_00805, partial [Chloroflexota bacterium]|nr:hypothetical protein [Chloroflexota bacterium]
MNRRGGGKTATGHGPDHRLAHARNRAAHLLFICILATPILSLSGSPPVGFGSVQAANRYQAFVVSDGVTAIYNADTGALIGSLSTGTSQYSSPNSIVASPDGSTVYIGDGTNVLKVNTAGDSTTVIPAGGYASGLALNGNTLYVTHGPADSYSVVDTESGTVLSTETLPGGAYGIAAAGGSLYISLVEQGSACDQVQHTPCTLLNKVPAGSATPDCSGLIDLGDSGAAVQTAPGGSFILAGGANPGLQPGWVFYPRCATNPLVTGSYLDASSTGCTQGGGFDIHGSSVYYVQNNGAGSSKSLLYKVPVSSCGDPNAPAGTLVATLYSPNVALTQSSHVGVGPEGAIWATLNGQLGQGGSFAVSPSGTVSGPLLLGGYIRAVLVAPGGPGVVAPPLDASISFPGSPRGTIPSPNPGDSVTVAVTVSAGSGTGNLSNLTFAGAPLQISPSGAFQAISGPTPPVSGPFTLAPNSHKTVTYKLKAVKLGKVTLRTNVRGQTAQGSAVNASDQALVTVGVKLKVDLTYTPHSIKIPLDKKNKPIPQPFSLKVKVTNPFTKVLHNVTLDKSPILEKMGADIAVPIELDSKRKQPRPFIGTLAAGASKSLTFAFLAKTDGQGRVTWTAQADNPDVHNQTIRGVGSVVASIDPTVILQLDLNVRTPPGQGKLVKSGDSVTVGGVLTNITNADVVRLDAIDPQLTGNAGGGNPIDPDNPPPANAYPLPIAPTLGPAEVQAFTADIQTVVSAGTRATVTYAPTGKVEKPDGSKVALTPDEIVSNPKDGQEIISIDDSAPPPATPADFTSEVAQFSIGFGQGSAQWLVSTYDTVAWLLKSAPSAILTIAKAPIQLLQTLDYNITYWAYLTPSARDQWYTDIATGILAQTTKLGKTLPEVKAHVDEAVTNWLNGLTNAWYAGDWNTVCNFAGQVSGNVALEAASWSVHLPEAAELIKLGDAAKEANVTKRVAEGLKALQAGDDLTRAGQALSKLYGLTTAQIEALQLLAKEKGLLIAAR